MDDQIGIAANGRGEVRVAGRGQREVALVAVAVAGLFQRPEHQVAQDALLGFAFDLLDQPLVVARREVDIVQRDDLIAESFHRRRAPAQRIAEVRGDLLELQHALGIGALVDAEDGRDFQGFQMRGDGFIGRQHELLDQAMRDVARRARDAGHFAELVELEQRLGQIEIDGPAADALAVQDQRQLLHPLEALDQPLVALEQRWIAFEHAMDRGVGHAFGAADDAASEFLGDHVALRVDLQKRGEHQPVFVRAQRALIGR